MFFYRGAGTGGLGLAIEGPSEAKMSCKDNKDGSCTVEYIPFTAGDYDVNITFGGQPIPGGPGGWGHEENWGGRWMWRLAEREKQGRRCRGRVLALRFIPRGPRPQHQLSVMQAHSPDLLAYSRLGGGVFFRHYRNWVC